MHIANLEGRARQGVDEAYGRFLHERRTGSEAERRE